MSDKLQRTISRFQQRIDNKEFYEAHQTLRTITNRYVKATQYRLATGILIQGASILSANKEYASASDLISYLIEIYTEEGVQCTSTGPEKEHRAKLIELITLLPHNEPSIGDLAKIAMTWAQSDGSSTFGDASLHHIFGTKLLAAIPEQANDEDRCKLFAVAEMHLILGNFESLPLYIDYLFNWYVLNQETVESSADPGMFLARAVINYAYLKNIKFVQASVDQFLQKFIDHTSDSFEESDIPIIFQNNDLLNFLQLLLVTLKKSQAGDKFMRLYGHYKPLLIKTKLIAPVEYLGHVYFGLNLGPFQDGNYMFANFMGNLLK